MPLISGHNEVILIILGVFEDLLGDIPLQNIALYIHAPLLAGFGNLIHESLVFLADFIQQPRQFPAAGFRNRRIQPAAFKHFYRCNLRTGQEA